MLDNKVWDPAIEQGIAIAGAVVAKLPPTVEPTTAELEAAVWDKLVQAGRDARATGDDVKWTVGRLAVTAAKTFAVDKDGNPIDQKRKFVLKDFAVQIGMIDNPRMIYDYHDVAAYWSESAQAHFKDCTWSAFRETSRHGLPIDRASTIMHQHGHEPVGRIREVIVGKPAAPRQHSAEFEAMHGQRGTVAVMTDAWEQIGKLVADHPDAVLTLVVTWTDAARDRAHARREAGPALVCSNRLIT